MNEHEKLSDKNNYKIYIQQKFNRKNKIKTKYLTPDLELCKNINNALEFKNFQEAEILLSKIKYSKFKNIPLRVIIKYFESVPGEIKNE